ncbi:MAG: outer membrane beta-barrel protein [Alphaproteobacteria bacterium]|nr:outer membrane beta-barrel protein [Alphaproteobacteria bacterium]
MKSLRAFILGLAVFSLCASLAPANAQVEADGGLYWSMRGGLSQVANASIVDVPGYPATYTQTTDPTTGVVTTTLVTRGLNDHRGLRDLEMDYGWVAGAAIGYTWLYPDNSADLRMEFEGIYRRNVNGSVDAQYYPTTNNPDSDSIYTAANLPFKGSVSFRSAMFNVMLDFHTPTRIVPYVGLGAGVTHLVSKVGAINDDLLSPSWQAIGGVGYKLSPGTMLTLEFRYFALVGDEWSDLFQTDDLNSIEFDDWSMGVRFTF